MVRGQDVISDSVVLRVDLDAPSDPAMAYDKINVADVDDRT